MPVRPILRLLLAGLLAAALAPVPLTLNPSLDPGPLTLDPPSAHADGPGDWPMFRHDPAHTGYNAHETQLKPPLRLKWSYATDGWVFSAPAIAGGKVYVVSDDGKVYALDASTGTLSWSYQTGGAIRSSPAVVGGVVYVGSRDRKVYALDAASGNLLWSYQTGSDVYSAPTVAGGVVYVGSEDGNVYALDAITATISVTGTLTRLRWSFPTGRVSTSPAVARGMVYVGSTGDGKVYALDSTTGAKRWDYATGGMIFSSPVVSGSAVYVGSTDKKVYALDADTGGLLWNYTTGDRVDPSPAVAGGVVYVGNLGGTFYALDATSGALKWRYNNGTAFQSSPAVAGGVVYVGSNDKNVYALDGATGAVRWSYTTRSAVPSDPAVANGVLYVGSNDNNVYAFETEAPRPPQAPGVIQPQTPTAFDRTVVSGIAEQGLTVKLYANGAYVGQATAGSFGIWNFTNVSLALGANILYATATDAAGNTSLLSTPVVVDRVEVWAPPPAPQASAVITTTGGTVAAGNSVTVTVPSGAFAEEVNLTLTPYAAASAPGVFGVVSANAFTSITAVATSSGAKVTSFQQPVTITIAYNPAALGGVPEANLQVSRYDEATRQWVALPSLVDTVNHTVSTQTSRFSVYDAQVSLLTNKVYLPLVSRSAGGW